MILLIDGNNLAFVANSIGRLSTSEDFPLQAIHGFLNALRGFVKKFEPEKIFVFWDGGKSKARLKLCPDYKARRKDKTPQQEMQFEELKMQTPVIQEAIGYLGLPIISGPGIEGDDLLAKMASLTHQQNKKAVIISSDSDFYQMVTENISIYSTTSSKKQRHVTHKNFDEVADGLTPAQYLEYKAIIGDSSDDIAGVKGAGPGTAVAVLTQFGTLENFRNEVISKSLKLSARQKYIFDNPDLLQRNIKMMDLWNPAGDLSGGKVKVQPPELNKLKILFFKYQLKQFYLEFNEWISSFRCLKHLKDS